MDESKGADGLDTSAADARTRIKDAAATAIDRTKEVAGERIGQGAERAATSVQSAASALRRAADDIEPDNAWLGMALRKSAEGLDTASRSLGGGDVSHSVEQVAGFARRQPALFLGASVALGFALARVGKTALEGSHDPMPGM